MTVRLLQVYLRSAAHHPFNISNALTYYAYQSCKLSGTGRGALACLRPSRSALVRCSDRTCLASSQRSLARAASPYISWNATLCNDRPRRIALYQAA